MSRRHRKDDTATIKKANRTGQRQASDTVSSELLRRPFEKATIALLNRKGGVGKTSFCHHVGGFFAQNGKRVLLVDNDPQASLTQGLLGAKAALTLRPEETLAALYGEAEEPEPEKIIRATRFENLCLAPCSAALNRLDTPEIHAQQKWQDALGLFLGEARDRFDLALIDCRPTLNFLSWTALLAADCVIIPLGPEDYASQGIVHVLEMVRLARRVNPRLRLLGYLLQQVRPLSLHAAYEAVLRDQYGPLVFRSRVPDLKDYKESISAQTPVGLYRPRSPATAAVRAVAEEMVLRLSSAEDEAVVPLGESIPDEAGA